MSLTVPADLLDTAQRGEVSDEEFIDCIRTSLPYAWAVVSQVASDLKSGGGDFTDHQTPPPSDVERGQLLRALASDAIRGALQRHFGLTLAFQNCHRVAAFRHDAVGTDRHRAFTSARAQLLNQSPELRNC